MFYIQMSLGMSEFLYKWVEYYSAMLGMTKQDFIRAVLKDYRKAVEDDDLPLLGNSWIREESARN